MSSFGMVMLERLLLVYGAPESDNPSAYMEEYARQLRNYRADELSRATDNLLRTRKFKTWPTIGECVEAADFAREQLREKHPAKPTGEDSMWSEAARKWADEQLRNDDGRTGVEEGWLLGVHEHFRANYAKRDTRWPSPPQMRAIQENAEYIDRCASGEINMGACHSALQNLAKSMVERRTKLAQRLFADDQS